jgi:ABC-type lipoprotein export system ATPase subunit
MGANQVHALAGLDWSLPTGSFWAIIGPSGSGKSTLLITFSVASTDQRTGITSWKGGT